MSSYDENTQFTSLMNILHSTESSLNMNRILMQRLIDTSWVEAIEKGMIHVDNILRAPSRTIEDVEEIVPIALSRKITVESVKHLAQHTDLIQSVDKVTGKITPSKILNVYKEETLLTYENKFINTLIERLRIFINLRYEKLAEVSNDGEIFTLGFSTSVDDHQGGKTKIEINIENEHDMNTTGQSTYTAWQRVEKLKKIIEGYKESELCKTLGNTYIRPPVMRTNAIMKNVDLKACLGLWQFIESYDKVGYEINIENSAMMPDDDFVDDFYELIGLNMLLFRASASPTQELLEARQLEPIAPKVVKQFDNVEDRFDLSVGGGVGYVSQEGETELSVEIPEDKAEIEKQIRIAIKIEQAYREEQRVKELEAQREAEELERQRAEEARIEAERQAELARIAERKAAKEREIQEMLERAREEQEAAERERIKQEQELIRKLEEKRKQEEEEKARLEEERLQKAIEEAERQERIRIAREKWLVRSVFGSAEGVEIEEEDRSIFEIYLADENNENETPAEIVLRKRKEQELRAKERLEAEHAQKLDSERRYFESKSFEEIYREYCLNPIWVLIRFVRHILAMVFGIIPKNTDRPDYKQRSVMIVERREEKKHEKETRSEMEYYYKKYGQTFRYRFMRGIQDIKFKRKRRKQNRNKPIKPYTTTLTPEQQKAVQKEMRALYKRYHVSLSERTRRWYKSQMTRIRPWLDKISAVNKKPFKVAASVAGSVILVLSLCVSIYVTVCTVTGNVVDIFGYSVLKVETGSMEPTLHVGDFIIIRRCDPEEIVRGDIISYYTEQEDISGMLITHRVIEVTRDGTFIARGDANPVSDALPVKPENILGVYVRKSSFYMWLGSFADTSKLFLLFVLLPLTLVSVYELRSMILIGKESFAEGSKSGKKKAQDDYERRMREAIKAEKERLARENYQPGYDDGYPPPDQDDSYPQVSDEDNYMTDSEDVNYHQEDDESFYPQEDDTDVTAQEDDTDFPSQEGEDEDFFPPENDAADDQNYDSGFYPAYDSGYYQSESDEGDPQAEGENEYFQPEYRPSSYEPVKDDISEDPGNNEVNDT